MLHYREAAKWAGVSWAVFCDLALDEQAGIIAHYETMTRLEAVEAEDHRREAEVARQRARAKAARR